MLAAAAGTPFVLWKLYTGRHPERPVLTAMQEQPLVLFLGVCAAGVGLAVALGARRIIENRPWFNPVWLWRRRRGELALLAGALFVCLLLLEGASRLLFAQQYGFPLGHKIEEIVYLPLCEQFQQRPYSEDDVNVLLLGGSVLWRVGLTHELEDTFDAPVRVVNMAQNAHSSLDSVNKLEWLVDQGRRFDYIIFYHAINETRANNAPPDVFREDYDHYSFYRLTNTVFQGKRPALGVVLRSSLGFRCYRLWATLRETAFFGRRYVHMAFPREDWLKYGAEVRSAASFRRNLERIADLADAYGSVLVVPYYAYNPQLDAWAEAGGSHMTEWGLAEYVRKGIRAHNEEARRLSARFVYVEDSEALMADKANFIDPCHFTEEAEQVFIGFVKRALRRAEGPTGQ